MRGLRCITFAWFFYVVQSLRGQYSLQRRFKEVFMRLWWTVVSSRLFHIWLSNVTCGRPYAHSVFTISRITEFNPHSNKFHHGRVRSSRNLLRWPIPALSVPQLSSYSTYGCLMRVSEVTRQRPGQMPPQLTIAAHAWFGSSQGGELHPGAARKGST
eukprot:887849-Amphidinium_carterae.2